MQYVTLNIKRDLPELVYADAKETYETLHLWTQIIGKIKLQLLPWINHSWHVTLSVTPVGFTTGTIPYGKQYFQIDLDFLSHVLRITDNLGKRHQFELGVISVSDFYHKIFKALADWGIAVKINQVPNEMTDVVPFNEDTSHRAYHAEQVAALHAALLFAQEVFTIFRSRFTGKSSPVHFFWGSFDLAVSRFSGKAAPQHPGGIPHLPDWVAREAYSHEVCSCGFWPGNEMLPFAAFYTYIYPEPGGFKDQHVTPEAAYYHEGLKEFILPYGDIRVAENPAGKLLDFLQGTYNAAADLAEWKNLEL